ncbi:hypothetical protein XENOCAPTIV_008700, partial [Xenoophorus captivus]
VLLPIANWKPNNPPVLGDDIGPQILAVYELLNNGPSTFSKASLDVDWPYRFKNGSLLYITNFDTEGPIKCTTDVEINPLNDCSTAECLRVRCQVGRLERTKNAILFIYSRLDVNNFLRVKQLLKLLITVSMSVTWVTDTSQPVPGWVVALAVLSGLLLLALLIFIMYKEDCTEKEQLQPEENGNTDA